MKTIITIGRQFGSGGKEIGIRVAKELGIPFYDKELLQEAAKKSGLCEQIFESFDERPKSLLYSIAMDSYMFALPGTGVGDSLEQQVYLATFNTIRHLSRYLLKQRSGSIINISSVSGVVGNPGQANYSASKAGVIGLTKSVARELSSRGITCNAVAPGFIETEMTEKMPEAAKENLLAQVPLMRAGSVEDVAGVVTFLASERASYITGQVISVDGGMSM